MNVSSTSKMPDARSCPVLDTFSAATIRAALSSLTAKSNKLNISLVLNPSIISTHAYKYSSAVNKQDSHTKQIQHNMTDSVIACVCVGRGWGGGVGGWNSQLVITI